MGGRLADRFGGKIVLAAGVLSWSLFTVLTPPAAQLGLAILIATRIAMELEAVGLGLGRVEPYREHIDPRLELPGLGGEPVARCGQLCPQRVALGEEDRLLTGKRLVEGVGERHGRQCQQHGGAHRPATSGGQALDAREPEAAPRLPDLDRASTHV